MCVWCIVYLPTILIYLPTILIYVSTAIRKARGRRSVSCFNLRRQNFHLLPCNNELHASSL